MSLNTKAQKEINIRNNRIADAYRNGERVKDIAKNEKVCISRIHQIINTQNYLDDLHAENEEKLKIYRQNNDLMNVPMEILNPSERLSNVLHYNSLTTIGNVLECTRKELLRIKNMGQGKVDELCNLLKKVGVKPRHNWSVPPKKKQHIIVEVISGVVSSVYCEKDADVDILDYDYYLEKKKYFKSKEDEIKKMKKVYQKK